MFIVSVTFRWVPKTVDGTLPEFTTHGGRDSDDSPIYIARTHHEGNILPVNVIPDKRIASFAWAGEEHVVKEVEYLTGHYFGKLCQAVIASICNFVLCNYRLDSQLWR